jgi:hypothetical protein
LTGIDGKSKADTFCVDFLAMTQMKLQTKELFGLMREKI